MFRLMALLLALAAFGCGPPTISVSGKVTYEGEAVEETVAEEREEPKSDAAGNFESLFQTEPEAPAHHEETPPPTPEADGSGERA